VSAHEAIIFIGRLRFLSTPVELRGRDGGGGDRSINFIGAGIRLEGTPYTGGEGESIVDGEPGIRVWGAPNPITGLPDKATRRAETIMRVRDGETIIIGGLSQMEERSIRNKIPFLGDLPLIGSLFRSTVKQHTETELVVFVTPRLLTTTGHLPDSDEERRMMERFQIPAPTVAPVAPGAPVAPPNAPVAPGTAVIPGAPEASVSPAPPMGPVAPLAPQPLGPVRRE
ncbi:MAG: hypothetical protein KY468_20195, partial [Armatimonadetes bacterium]|nr:hypothetical protein [Armatimonadota bacterium]